MSGNDLFDTRLLVLIAAVALTSGCSAATHEGSDASASERTIASSASVPVEAEPVAPAPATSGPVASASSSGPRCDAAPRAAVVPLRELSIDSVPALNATPELPVRAVAPASLEAFPAVSEDGSLLVALASDAEDFSGRSVERLRFYALPSGRVESTFMLHDERADDAAKSPKERAHHLRELETAWSQAKSQLARSKWRSLEKGAGISGSECEPWATSYSHDAASQRFRRFEIADMDTALQLGPDGRVASLQVRRVVDGKVVSTHTHVTFPAVGSAFGHGECGAITGLEAAFITPDRRTLFLLPQAALGGDSCAATLQLDRVKIVTLPPT